MGITDQLGIDAEISNERLTKDEWLSRMLSEMGKTYKKDEVEYVGSICTHIYKTSGKISKEVRFLHHHHFESVPGEKVVSIAVSDLALHLMQVVFGQNKPGSRDPKDKRTKN